jgi:hypothetical protein
LIAFPIRELFDVKLSEFDLIIFDRYSRRGVIPQAYIQNVVNYVRKGGAFLEATGPSFGTPMSLFRTPLGEILPTEPSGTVEEEGFKPELTIASRCWCSTILGKGASPSFSPTRCGCGRAASRAAGHRPSCCAA